MGVVVRRDDGVAIQPVVPDVGAHAALRDHAIAARRRSSPGIHLDRDGGGARVGDERREVALPLELGDDARDLTSAKRPELGERALQQLADRRAAGPDEAPPQVGAPSPPPRQPGGPPRPPPVDPGPPPRNPPRPAPPGWPDPRAPA